MYKVKNVLSLYKLLKIIEIGLNYVFLLNLTYTWVMFFFFVIFLIIGNTIDDFCFLLLYRCREQKNVFLIIFDRHYLVVTRPIK